MSLHRDHNPEATLCALRNLVEAVETGSQVEIETAMAEARVSIDVATKGGAIARARLQRREDRR